MAMAQTADRVVVREQIRILLQHIADHFINFIAGIGQIRRQCRLVRTPNWKFCSKSTNALFLDNDKNDDKSYDRYGNIYVETLNNLNW